MRTKERGKKPSRLRYRLTLVFPELKTVYYYQDMMSEAFFNCDFVCFRCTLNFTVPRNKIQKYLTKFTSECAIWADLIFSRVTTKWRITVSQWPTSGISNLTVLPSATKGSVEKQSKRGKILVSKARICKFQMEAFGSVPVTIGVFTRASFHKFKWRRLFSLYMSESLHDQVWI